MYKFRDRKKQQGFIQAALLFGIALMTIVLAGFAIANRSPSGNISEQEAKVMAGLVTQQGSALSDATASYLSVYNASRVATTMTFNDDDNDGLFFPDRNYGTVQVLSNPKAYLDSAYETNADPEDFAAGSWRLNRAVVVPNIGSATADVVAFLPYLTRETCEAINASLFGLDNAAPVVETALTTGVVGAANADGSTAFTGATFAATGLNRNTQACITDSAASPTIYAYYQVLLAR